MKFAVAVLLVLLAGVVEADDNIAASCKPISVEGEALILSTKEPLVIMIHNLSNADLWITHPVSEPSASAGWSSRLQASNWSALALDKESFELSCIESKPGHEQQIPCAGAIAVCAWSAVTIPEQTTGTFWAGEDMTLSALKAHLAGRGFGLPAAAQ